MTPHQDKKAIAQNISNQARNAKALFIWTDCDREGEYIGAEVRQAAFQGNARLEIKRAQFSNTERAYGITLFEAQTLADSSGHSHVLRAAQNPVPLDEGQVNAVGARIEIDLRLGAVFTRFQTLTLQLMGGDLSDRMISYGSYPELVNYSISCLTAF